MFYYLAEDIHYIFFYLNYIYSDNDTIIIT